MKYFEIAGRFKNTQSKLKDLEFEYTTKLKGDAYNKRKLQLITTLNSLKTKAKKVGTAYTICHIRGKRTRPSRRNPSILIQEGFSLYFSDIDEKEAAALVKLHVKNVLSYQISFHTPGLIITSS